MNNNNNYNNNYINKNLVGKKSDFFENPNKQKVQDLYKTLQNLKNKSVEDFNIYNSNKENSISKKKEENMQKIYQTSRQIQIKKPIDINYNSNNSTTFKRDLVKEFQNFPSENFQIFSKSNDVNVFDIDDTREIEIVKKDYLLNNNNNNNTIKNNNILLVNNEGGFSYENNNNLIRNNNYMNVRNTKNISLNYQNRPRDFSNENLYLNSNN